MESIVKNRISEIVRLHKELEDCYRMNLPKAIRIGELLAEVKAELDHGAFLPWIKANLSFSERAARNYMNVYRRRDELKTARVADLTEAYKQLTPPKGIDYKPKNDKLIPPSGHRLVGFAPNRPETHGIVAFYIEPAVDGAYYYITAVTGPATEDEMGYRGTLEGVWKEDLFKKLNKWCDAENIIAQIEEPCEPRKYNRFFYDSYEDYRDNFADRIYKR